MEVNVMPKNNASPKGEPGKHQPSKKNNAQNNNNFNEAAQMVNIDKAADYVPSLNGVSKTDV
jgi:hypothetical protein